MTNNTIWEYELYDYNDHTSLNRVGYRFEYLGKEGWELVTIYYDKTHDKHIAVFKRPIYRGGVEASNWTPPYGDPGATADPGPAFQRAPTAAELPFPSIPTLILDTVQYYDGRPN